MGDVKWLTVVSPDETKGVELLPEPMGFAPARTYQKALFDAGIPALLLVSLVSTKNTKGWKNQAWCSKQNPKRWGLSWLLNLKMAVGTSFR